MGESVDYKRLKKNWPEPRDRIDRIENIVVFGMPDINMCISGVEVWVEQKSPKEPKRASTALFGSNHKLSIEQRNWFLRQKNAKGRGFILICSDKRWMLIDGRFADDVNNFTVEELIEIALWHEAEPIRGKEKWISLRKAMTANLK